MKIEVRQHEYELILLSLRHRKCYLNNESEKYQEDLDNIKVETIKDENWKTNIQTLKMNVDSEIKKINCLLSNI